MSRSITVREVPEEVVDRLQQRAQASGLSLQEYLRRVLAAEAVTPLVTDWLDAVQETRRRIGLAEEGAGLSVIQILSARAADRS